MARHQRDLDQVLGVGCLLILETGMYSDKGWTEPMRMLKTATLRQLADAYTLASKFDKTLRYDGWDDDVSPAAGTFAAWLVRVGFCEAVDACQVWHIGDCGRFEV